MILYVFLFCFNILYADKSLNMIVKFIYLMLGCCEIDCMAQCYGLQS